MNKEDERRAWDEGERTFDAMEALLAASDEDQPEAARSLWATLPDDVRIALAKAAPVVAGPWRDADSTKWLTKRVRRLPEGSVVASYVHEAARGLFCICGGDITVAGHSLEEAQSACDAELIRQGYVLTNEVCP